MLGHKVIAVRRKSAASSTHPWIESGDAAGLFRFRSEPRGPQHGNHDPSPISSSNVKFVVQYIRTSAVHFLYVCTCLANPAISGRNITMVEPTWITTKNPTPVFQTSWYISHSANAGSDENASNTSSVTLKNKLSPFLYHVLPTGGPVGTASVKTKRLGIDDEGI